jgi:acetolactate synthase-1/3 small subunit
MNQRYFSRPVAGNTNKEIPTPNPHLEIYNQPTTFKQLEYQVESSTQESISNLLYNVPKSSTKSSKHVLCALVSNEPGVLSRVSGVLAGRGFNIDSLVVSETETTGLSRMTIVLQGGEVSQAKKQLEDLVQVWAAVEFQPHAPIVERELLLVKLNIIPAELARKSQHKESQEAQNIDFSKKSTQSASTSMSIHIQRQAIVELCNLFQGRVVDLTPEHIMIELTGKTTKIDAFVELVRPFGIRELARSGTLAMLRSQITSIKSQEKAVVDNSGQVDATQLPPG